MTIGCAVCELYGHGLFYKCSGGCEWWIHLGCTGDFDAAVVDDVPTMKHPSHPKHYLIFSKKTRWCSFPCDACGASHKGNSYICTLCDYWIHETCALLPISNNENAVADVKDIIKGPIDDIYEEIIRPFVKRVRELVSIPQKTCHKHHLLSFTTFPSSSPPSSTHHHNHEEEEEEEEDYKEDSNIPGLELTCDGCTLPIHEKTQRDEYENGYMSCDECKYFLHLSCFNLPPHLPSHPLHLSCFNLQPYNPFFSPYPFNLTLRNTGKLTYWAYCNICEAYTNGLFYTCTKCGINIDIKCASLPNTIKHAAHPQHNHLMNLVTDNRRYNFCGVCYDTISSKHGFYRCNSCKFCMCAECVLLPAQNKHRLEKHRLWLTYDAYVNRPGDFYCSSCENQMHSRRRMYYCRDCDQSFHSNCIPGRSGKYRNIKYGMQQYVIPTLHHPHHPLRFQIITKKKRCDLCHDDHYDEPGFQCVSCYFVMCWSCTKRHRDEFKAI
ncbi:uncharacterized protein LOC130990053 [Salvia miltiorrhiza]|uniref:uncharacterized protein LOC130990053 n=1 Tax=Salvia miltiorrhiza TaxID=226208 RepID=UPI0025ABBCAA|nr:uncharacterized protein LOC130990053 [Salvia miltiorrhiza]